MFFRTHSTQERKRAPGQHARIVERRGALLRHALRCSEEQLVNEGLKLACPQLLVQAVFDGNTMLSCNGATPYNVRFGTQPALVPDIHALRDDSLSMNGRSMQRLREVALQRIIEATAVARIRRASPGDLVNFYREPRSKDAPAWSGPARVTKNIPERGQVLGADQNEERSVKDGDARRFMDLLGLLAAVYTAHSIGNAMTVVQPYVASLPVERFTTIGHPWTIRVAHECRDQTTS